MPETCKGKVCPKLSAPDNLVNCIEHRCAHYQQILGEHPQTGEALGQWDCAFNWTNILLIGVGKDARQTAAAVESARNEARKDAAAIGGGLLAVADEVAVAAREISRIPGERLLTIDDVAGGGDRPALQDARFSPVRQLTDKVGG